MATKKKAFPIRIKPEYCKNELKFILNSIGKLKSVDAGKGIFKSSYRYGLQNIQIIAVIKESSGLSIVQVMGKTDDVFGTGAEKAIRKIEESLRNVESKYAIDFDIEKGYSSIIKGEYETGYSLLKNAESKRPENIKLNYGLGLYFAKCKDESKAEQYLKKAIDHTIEDQKFAYRKMIAVQLFKLDSFHLAKEVFFPILAIDRKEDTILLFLLINLKAGDIDQVLKCLIENFKSSPSLFIKLYRDKGVSNDERNVLIQKQPLLIKTIRRNTVFNLSNNSIAFLLEQGRINEVSDYRKCVKQFYEGKNRSFEEFVKSFKQIGAQVFKINTLSISLLKEKDDAIIKEFSDKVRLLSDIANRLEEQMDFSDFQDIFTQVKSILEKLENINSFDVFYRIIGECKNLIPQLLDVLFKTRELTNNRISQFLDKGMSNEAQDLISEYKSFFNEEPKDLTIFAERLKRIQLNRTISQGNASVVDKLKKYHEMLLEGLITQDDFNMIKKEILNG
jgi:hypothetical protein